MQVNTASNIQTYKWQFYKYKQGNQLTIFYPQDRSLSPFQCRSRGINHSVSPPEHPKSIPCCLCHVPCCYSGTYLGQGDLCLSYTNCKIHHLAQRNGKQLLIHKSLPPHTEPHTMFLDPQNISMQIFLGQWSVYLLPFLHPVSPLPCIFLYLFILHFICESRNFHVHMCICRIAPGTQQTLRKC